MSGGGSTSRIEDEGSDLMLEIAMAGMRSEFDPCTSRDEFDMSVEIRLEVVLLIMLLNLPLISGAIECSCASQAVLRLCRRTFTRTATGRHTEYG